MPNLKFVLAPTPTPDASQWNIGGVGSQRKIPVEYGLKALITLCVFRVALGQKTQNTFCVGYTPIFHCDAKSLALGTFASPNANDSTFASPNAKDSTFALPYARNTNMLVSFALGDANFLRWPCTFHFLCVDFIRVG